MLSKWLSRRASEPEDNPEPVQPADPVSTVDLNTIDSPSVLIEHALNDPTFIQALTEHPLMRQEAALGLLEKQTRSRSKKLNRFARDALEVIKRDKRRAETLCQRASEISQAIVKQEQHPATASTEVVVTLHQELHAVLSDWRALDEQSSERHIILTAPSTASLAHGQRDLTALEQKFNSEQRIQQRVEAERVAAEEQVAQLNSELNDEARRLLTQLHRGGDVREIVDAWANAKLHPQANSVKGQSITQLDACVTQLNGAIGRWHHHGAPADDPPRLPDPFPDSNELLVDVYANAKLVQQHAHQIERALSRVAWPSWAKPLPDIEHAQTVEEYLKTELARLNDFVQTLRGHLHELLSLAGSAVQAGQLARANDALGAAVRARNRLGPHADKKALGKLADLNKQVGELKSWQTFATTPKRKVLCQQMQALAAQNEIPESDARAIEAQVSTIKALRSQWSALGNLQNASDAHLSDTFNRAAEKAFEPCRKHYAELKRVRAENTRRHELICEQLDDYLKNVDWPQADLKAAHSIMRTARNEWNRFFPIEQKRHKALVKRFEVLQERLHGNLQAGWTANLDRKQAIVDEANALLEDATLSHAEKTANAKRLQRRWQQVGPTPRKPDQELWARFRSACDALFDAQAQAVASANNERETARKSALALVEEFSNIINETEPIDADEAVIKAYRGRWRTLARLEARTQKSLDAAFRQQTDRYQALVQQRDQQRKLQNLEARRTGDQALTDPDLALDVDPLRDLVLRAELATDTPANPDDGKRRLELQVARLNDSLRGTDGSSGEKSNSSTVMDLVEQWCALGAKPDDDRVHAWRDRLFAAAKKALLADHS